MGTVPVFECKSLFTFLIFVISMEEHARFVNLFVLIFVWIVTVYLLNLFCSATVPLCFTAVLWRARHIRLTSIDASKWYWDGNSLYRKMTFPKCSAPVCSCIWGGSHYTVKVRPLESIFTRYMALFKVPWCLALETSLKRPRQDTCHS